MRRNMWKSRSLGL